MPKPLVPLNGTPLLHHLLRYLKFSGVDKFVLCVGHLAEQIERFARGLEGFAGSITCVNSGEASMIDRILDARRHVADRALVCYGDTLANVDVAALEELHVGSGALATVTVYPFHSPFGIVEIDHGGRVTAFREKPILPHWINIGFLLCEPEALDHMARGSDLDQFLTKLSRAGRLSAYRHGGRHLTVNTDRDRAFAESQISEFVTLIEGVNS
jgi:glucose-1-phosphate cytidylyltransferase